MQIEEIIEFGRTRQFYAETSRSWNFGIWPYRLTDIVIHFTKDRIKDTIEPADFMATCIEALTDLRNNSHKIPYPVSDYFNAIIFNEGGKSIFVGGKGVLWDRELDSYQKYSSEDFHYFELGLEEMIFCICKFMVELQSSLALAEQIDRRAD